MFFGNKSRERQTKSPTKQAQVSEDILVNLWVGERENGRRVDWSLSRVNRNGGGDYRTFRPADLLQIGGLAALAGVFAKSSEMNAELRAKFASLAEFLAEIDRFMKQPVAAAEKLNGNDPSSALAI